MLSPGPALRATRWCAVVATSYIAACSPILPGEPELPVSFALNFDFPYRVSLNGDAQQPPINVLVGSDPVPGTVHKLESLNRSVVDVDASGQGLMGLARDTASVRIVYTTGTGTADTVFPVRVVVDEVVFRRETGLGCNPFCRGLILTFSRLGDNVHVQAFALDARNGIVPDVDLTWISWDPEVATVSTTGLVTAVSEGDLWVTAEVDDVSGHVTGLVKQTASAVQVAPEADTLHTVGRSVRFAAAVFDSTGALLPLAKPRWWSDDTTVAVVDPVGVVTSRGAGTAQIVAQVGEVADSATLVVDQVLRFLFVTPPLDTLTAVDDTVRVVALGSDSLNFPMANPDVVWSSGDTSIVTVDPSGLVTARANGAALVTATSEGQSAFATLVVRQAPGLVSLVEDNVALTGTGDTARLTVEVADHNGYPMDDADPVRLTWRTLSPLVAFVDSTGLVSAFEDGITGIVVSVADTTEAPADTAVVTVTGAPPQEWIGFSSRNGIELISPYGGTRTVLTDRRLHYPAWSPDGDVLVATSTFNSGCGLVHVDVADPSQVSPLTQPTGEWECDWNAAWSPDGNAIAFARVDCPWYCAGKLFTIGPDGSQLTELSIEGPTHAEIHDWPAWLPGGEDIAFSAVETDYSKSFGIYVAPPSGGEAKALIAGNAYDAEWSPDGSLMAYVLDTDIWVSDAGGGNARNLTQSSIPNAWSPAWSPDGTQIVFVGSEDSSEYDLYVIQVDGTGLRRLTFGDQADYPTWRRAVPLPVRPGGGAVASGDGSNR